MVEELLWVLLWVELWLLPWLLLLPCWLDDEETGACVSSAKLDMVVDAVGTTDTFVEVVGFFLGEIILSVFKCRSVDTWRKNLEEIVETVVNMVRDTRDVGRSSGGTCLDTVRKKYKIHKNFLKITKKEQKKIAHCL